jgi:peptidoglycan/xylan/chitin deacetylase (PgdA/CDA1 family)
MRVASKFLLAAGLSCLTLVQAAESPAPVGVSCDKPVYLTFDTGHMDVAPLIADVLNRNGIRATFFLANEPTRTGGRTLDAVWAPWWKALTQQGHVFASHTFDHVYWQSDLTPGHFKMRPSSGAQTGKSTEWTSQQYCDAIGQVEVRFEEMTGQKMLPLFRAPGGRTSAALLQAAEGCGYKHVGWSPAGFLGDELSSAKYPNALLLERATRTIRSGDILMAHLGIWSRQDPWAPAVLETLIENLNAKGFCFATIDEHPEYRAWIVAHRAASSTETQAAVLPLEEPAISPSLDLPHKTTDQAKPETSLDDGQGVIMSPEAQRETHTQTLSAPQEHE